MSKNLGRDAKILLMITENILRIRDVITRYNCSLNKASGSKYLLNNIDALELSVFNLSQIGEKIKLLTDESKAYLGKFCNINIFVYARNIIDHDYENAKKDYLVMYISQVVSTGFYNAVIDRREYCRKHKKV